MTLNDVLNWIIDDGIEAARADYTRPDQRLKLDGAIKGFEDCRARTPDEVALLLTEADETARRAMLAQAPDYWYWRCRAAEIGWVANVLSNVLVANGARPISMMTYRGALKAAEIIGVGSPEQRE